MSRYFVTDAPVPIAEFDDETVVSDQPPNIIFIKARMDVETNAKVQGELIAMGADNKVELRIGENSMALLVHNITGWAGPDFDGVPCDAAHIKRLDINNAHVARVLEEVTARNRRQESPNPKSAGVNGSLSGTERELVISSSPAPTARGKRLA
jgi:hypothetical protein